MPNFVLGALSKLEALLFQSEDSLSIPQNPNDVSVSSSGVTTVLGFAGTSIAFPSANLSKASLAGQVSFADGRHLMIGTNSAETIAAGQGGAIVYAFDGDDIVTAGNDPSYIYGGGGSDVITGGTGNDHLYGFDSKAGSDGNDTLSGGEGDDYIQGNAGNDVIDGGTGNDRIQGGADNDLILGGDGDDAINGNFGNDTIDGGSGNDLLRGGKGDDLIQGGAGDDTIRGDLGADTLGGGGGHDVFAFAGNDAALVSTDPLAGHVDTILDFTVGDDQIALGFRPVEVLQGSSQASPGAALAQATMLLAGHAGDVVAVSVGSDTYLFYNSLGGSSVDSVIDLHDLSSSTLSVHDFI